MFVQDTKKGRRAPRRPAQPKQRSTLAHLVFVATFAVTLAALYASMTL